MNKTWIIFKREYLNVVKKPAFLLSTFLIPIGFGAIFGIQILAALFVEEEQYTVFIPRKETPILENVLESSEELTFTVTDLPKDSLKARIQNTEDELVMELPTKESVDGKVPVVTIYASKNISLGVQEKLEKKVKQAIRDYKMLKTGITEDQLRSLEFKLDMQTVKWTESGDKETSVEIASAMGFIMGMLIYFLVGIYGSVLMQGVIEEKSNRIVEVIVSSVKPFHLLLGKTMALASVAVTQFLLWMLLSGGILLLISFVASFSIDADALAQQQQSGMDAAQAQEMAEKLLTSLKLFDWSVLWYFPLYFLGGFFLYGSLLAAAGSAVDNIQDAQQFTLPITLPMILPILFLMNIVQNPNSAFAKFASMFPLFSPVSMMVRMSCTDVPWYEIVLSLLLLVAAFLGCVWIAAKIYRVGILMYGKKPSFKELMRWITYK